MFVFPVLILLSGFQGGDVRDDFFTVTTTRGTSAVARVRREGIHNVTAVSVATALIRTPDPAPAPAADVCERALIAEPTPRSGVEVGTRHWTIAVKVQALRPVLTHPLSPEQTGHAGGSRPSSSSSSSSVSVISARPLALTAVASVFASGVRPATVVSAELVERR